MSGLVRVSISLEKELLQRFDRHTAERGYPTRSEALKALMRETLVEEQWQADHEVAGAVSLVYDHHRSGLAKTAVAIQHQFGGIIISTQHVHLDHDHCLEIIVVKGKAGRIRDLMSALRSVKGIKHTSIVMASTGVGLG